MADSTEGDSDIQYLGLLVPELISLIAGLVIHSFIIGVNVTDWWKGRSVTPVDHVITSLAICRMGAQCASNLHLYLDKLFLKKLDSSVILVIIGVIYDLFSYANFWLTTLLSIVLCLKISNFHTKLFLYLRKMIAHRTVYLIGALVLLSTFSCFIPLLEAITEETKERIYNTTMDNSSTDCSSINYMKMSSNLSINLETYYSVMKYVTFNFIYNAGYLIVDVVYVFYNYVYCEYPNWLLIVFGSLPALHSSYLIYRTAKLRSQMSKVLQNVTDFLFQKKYTETRENIEVVAV
ncbi:hypothetical protein GDO78_014944 [Eleutherodactylus coqui]|uniref:Taste receptor type 2 n=1 Tax=Eleutherodactylus coqui TaxID=57060 RepID=A0A8J6BBW2_ELECQ|nr:hypothetical protein GDO78_014944 [Eleutherodactylus coqui]